MRSNLIFLHIFFFKLSASTPEKPSLSGSQDVMTPKKEVDRSRIAECNLLGINDRCVIISEMPVDL
jgi:hypothetical protein